jgi:hypothetical protein
MQCRHYRENDHDFYEASLIKVTKSALERIRIWWTKGAVVAFFPSQALFQRRSANPFS